MSIHDLRAGEHTKLPLGPGEGSIFLRELPSEEDVNLRRDLNKLMMDGGVTIMTPLPEQLRSPLPKATVLLSLDDLSAGAHKQLSPRKAFYYHHHHLLSFVCYAYIEKQLLAVYHMHTGTPLAVSVDADVQVNELNIIHGVPEVKVVVPDFSLTSLEQDVDPFTNWLAELKQFQFLTNLWVIPRIHFAENTTGPDLEKIGQSLYRRIPGSSVLLSMLGSFEDVVKYVDFGSYYCFNNNLQKFVSFKMTLLDD
ncbi:putative (E)-4-hydroxy-3-methylbut-2-enyl-diphosphate synthase (ferredoxin) [Dioscorea sansibarensis]